MYKAIGYAYEQAIKTINWAKDGKSFLDNGTEVRISPAKKNYIICVTAENFGIIPSEINKYVTIDEKTKIIPYVVNIYDFEIVTNECKTIEEFWDYLDFRMKNADVVTLDTSDRLFHLKDRDNDAYKISISDIEQYLRESGGNYKNNCNLYVKVTSKAALYGELKENSSVKSVSLKQRQLFELD